MKAMGGLSEANLDDLKKQIDLAEFRGRHRRARDANGPPDANGGKSRPRRSRCLRRGKKGGRVVKSAKRCRRNRVKAMRSRRAHRRYMMTV